RFTRALYAGARVPERCKRLVVVPGKGHDGATQTAEFREAMEWLLSLRPPGGTAVTMPPPRRPTRESPDAAADLPAPFACTARLLRHPRDHQPGGEGTLRRRGGRGLHTQARLGPDRPLRHGTGDAGRAGALRRRCARAVLY